MVDVLFYTQCGGCLVWMCVVDVIQSTNSFQIKIFCLMNINHEAEEWSKISSIVALNHSNVLYDLGGSSGKVHQLH